MNNDPDARHTRTATTTTAGTAPVLAPTTAEAAAFVLAQTLGLQDLSHAEALAGLQRRVEALKDPLAPAALAEMRQHLPLLDSLFQRFSVEALRATRSEHRALLLRVALQAQQAYCRTFALLHGLALQAKGQGLVRLHDDDGDALAEAGDDRGQGDG